LRSYPCLRSYYRIQLERKDHAQLH